MWRERVWGCSIHNICGRCGSQHRMNLHNKSNKEALVCSNCKATKNDLHTGHGAVDRRCLIFLNRSHKMNKTRSKNKHKYYCTDDPATWEINDSYRQEGHNTKIYDTKRDNQGFEEVRGRYSRGGRGVGEDTQRVPDKGWEGIRTNTRAGGNKVNSKTQIEGSKHGNVIDSSHGDKHSQVLLPLTSNFVIYSLYTPQFYINCWCSHTYYPGVFYHQIFLDFPIQTHFKLCISDQNYQRYATSPFSSLKSSYFTSSWLSQEHYFLDNCSYSDLVLLYIPIK